MTIQVYPPWRNLGCFGVRVGRFYFDVYRRHYAGRFAFGMFICNGRGNRWYAHPFRIIRCR